MTLFLFLHWNKAIVLRLKTLCHVPFGASMLLFLWSLLDLAWRISGITIKVLWSNLYLAQIDYFPLMKEYIMKCTTGSKRAKKGPCILRSVDILIVYMHTWNIYLWIYTEPSVLWKYSWTATSLSPLKCLVSVTFSDFITVPSVSRAWWLFTHTQRGFSD